MDRRCCRPLLDAIAGSSPAYQPPTTYDAARPLRAERLEPESTPISEPSTAALLAVIATALVAAVAVIAFFPKPTPRSETPAPTHVCHMGGNLLIRCDDDM